MTRSNEQDIQGIQEHPSNYSRELYKTNLPLKLEIKYFDELRILEMDRDGPSIHPSSFLEETIVRKSNNTRNIIAIVKVTSMAEPDHACCRLHCTSATDGANLDNGLSLSVKEARGAQKLKVPPNVASEVDIEPGSSKRTHSHARSFIEGDRVPSVEEVDKTDSMRPSYRRQLFRDMERWRSVPDVAPTRGNLEGCPARRNRTSESFAQTEEMAPDERRTKSKRLKRFRKAVFALLLSCAKCCI